MSVGDFDRKTIIINSQFRESGDTNQFTWRFQERIENIRHAELRYFVLENGVYNVNNDNNTFYLYENFTSGEWENVGTVVIPTGSYDDLTFASTVGLCMTGVSVISGSNNIYLVQINSTGNLVISAQALTGTTPVNFGIGFYLTTIDSDYPQTALLMGFNLSPSTPDVPSYATTIAPNDALFYTIVSPNPTYLANYDYFLVQSQKLGNDISFYGSPKGLALVGGDVQLRGSATSCFAFIPNITPTNDVSSLIFNNQRPPQISTLKYPYSLDYVDIALVDKNGKLVDTRGNNVTLVIELYTDKQSQNVSSNLASMSLNRR
jgi:hypothetical protein